MLASLMTTNCMEAYPRGRIEMEAKKAFSEFIVSVMELECSPSASPKVSRMPDEVISEKENPFEFKRNKKENKGIV